jgi:hypothetical protein
MISLFHALKHKNHTTFEQPTFNYTTAADQRSGPLLPQWAAVCALLSLYALAQLGKYAVIAIKHAFPRVIRHGYGPISGAIAEQAGGASTVPKYGTTSASGPPAPEGSSRGGSASSTIVVAGDREEDEDAPASRREEDEQELFPIRNSLTTRIDRVNVALRTNLLVLLAASTLISLPIEYTCITRIGRVGDYAGLATGCGTCLANCTSTIITILTWLFVAASVVWALLELFVVDHRSSTVIRAALILMAQPLMIAVFVLAFARWNFLKGLSCNTPVHGGKLDAMELDLYDFLVHGSDLI